MVLISVIKIRVRYEIQLTKMLVYIFTYIFSMMQSEISRVPKTIERNRRGYVHALHAEITRQRGIN